MAGPVLLAMALIFALSANHWRFDGIDLQKDWSAESRFSKEPGFDNVHVLVNDWTVWQKAGLPVSENR